MHRDDDVRSSCFAALDVLCAKHGIEVPYDGGLDQGDVRLIVDDRHRALG